MVRDESVTVDMSAMVDLSFLLLVFFLVSTSLLAKEQELPMRVPGEGGPGDKKSVAIRVTADERVVLYPGEVYEEEVAAADEGHELPSLRERLGFLQYSRQGVQLEIAEDARYQRFIDVLNCLKSEGWNEISITEIGAEAALAL